MAVVAACRFHLIPCCLRTAVRPTLSRQLGRDRSRAVKRNAPFTMLRELQRMKSSGNVCRTVWVFARLAAPVSGTSGYFASLQDGGKAGFFAVNVTAGTSRSLLQETKSYMPIFNLDGNVKTGEIVFAATDQQHLHDLWIVDSKDGKTRQITHLNPDMERYELGSARLIEWQM